MVHPPHYSHPIKMTFKIAFYLYPEELCGAGRASTHTNTARALKLKASYNIKPDQTLGFQRILSRKWIMVAFTC